MRIATALLLLLVAVAAASLAVDRSDVDSQVGGRPYRVRIPNVASRVTSVGPIQPPPDALWFTVTIEVTAYDALPEFCCQPPTQILLVGTDFLTQGTTIETTWDTQEMTNHTANQPDVEGCTWTRVIRPSGADFAMTGTGLWGGGGSGGAFVQLNVYHPRWAYSITGCRWTTGEETGERTIDEYLRALFPDVPGGLIVDTPPNPGHLASCITHYAAFSGEMMYVSARVQIFIYTAPCNIPQPPFPF